MCTARPGPEGLRVARVPACPMWFREALHLVPGACGGRDRRGLVQRDVVGRTRTSELRYGDGIALPVGRDHVIGRGERRRAGSAGGGDRPSLRKHSGTASGRHSPRHHPAKAGGGGDERLHQPTRTGDRLIDLRAASEVITRALRRRRAGRRLEDRFKIGRERLPVDILPGLARPMLGGPDALPARCLVGAARKPRSIDKRLHQDRTVRVFLLPVIGPLPGRQAQRRRGQVGHPHTVEDHETGMDHHEMPCPVLLRRNFDRAPADPPITPPITKPAGSVDCGSSPRTALNKRQPQTVSDPLLMIPDEVLHRTAERVLGTEVVMRVH